MIEITAFKDPPPIQDDPFIANPCSLLHPHYSSRFTFHFLLITSPSFNLEPGVTHETFPAHT